MSTKLNLIIVTNGMKEFHIVVIYQPLKIKIHILCVMKTKLIIGPSLKKTNLDWIQIEI